MVAINNISGQYYPIIDGGYPTSEWSVHLGFEGLSSFSHDHELTLSATTT